MSLPFDLWGQRGWASMDVVGESHYATSIRALFGPGLQPDGSEMTVTVQLLPEAMNKHDRNAVGVWAGSRQLGYLSRQEAARYAPVLSALMAKGWTPQVSARVWAAARGGANASVRLELAEPHMIVPGNQPPGVPYRLLPVGHAIQVTGEDKHLDALTPWLRPEGECWVHATLHELTEQLPRSSRTVVEVRVDGTRVGLLSPKMSGDMLPAIRHLAERELVTATRAVVKGNRLKAEVVLYTARAHDLSESWLTPEAPAAPAPAVPIRAVPVPAAPVVTASAAVPVVPPAVAPTSTAGFERPRSDVSLRFQAPPNWPTPPVGWTPPTGWIPDPTWGPLPPGWQLWVEDTPAPLPPQPAQTAPGPEIPFFGARGRARELAAELSELRAEIDRLRADNGQLRAEMNRLGAFSVRELEDYRHRLNREITDRVTAAHAEQAALNAKLDELRREVVVTEETALLQEAGVYQYQHPLSDAVAYQSALAQLQEQIKAMAKVDGGAVKAASGWTVNGSSAQGRTMLRDYSKLMLRAYNAEADNLVRTLKPYKLEAAVDRLGRVAATIARLGKTMDIQITEEYHRLRVRELGLTADFQEKVAQERERDREEKARLREERRIQQEIEKERERLEKERQHYTNALAALQANGDVAGAAQLQERLAQIDTAIQDVDYRAANVRAGYVYVISNIGAFGENMVKVGMTRRLDPMDRVRELGDASVPFTFDVHALFFSDDAVGIEAQMHARLAARRVNLINQRREFFYASPAEVKQHLMELTGNLLQYEETPPALEYRQSRTSRSGAVSQ
ncbi:DUF4041 domain-containing protein [Actinoplanes sp. NPDC051861]|uniref:DUF4041 domain-containing protein n=1 Tax=Actinoplanes sp. NPDC051861 TaxID=3155170 RepID=UPI003423A67E